MKRLLLLVLALGVATAARAQAPRPTVSAQPLSDRRVAYDITARLDPERHRVHGRQLVTWRNPDRVPVDELQFHLYLNAFRNERSTFMRESGGQLRGDRAEGENRWGWIDVNRLRLVGGAGAGAPLSGTGVPDEPGVDLTDRIRFIQPDDGNADDRTVVSVKLPQPVGPGETVTLAVDFEAQLPKIFARTGWALQADGDPFYMVAQWFPKLGVYEIPGQRYVPAGAPRGAWNTHQFHADSEFYADFGGYRVSLTTPESFVVGATGVRTGESAADGQRTVTYEAEDVHDFAWTASSDFREFTDRWRHVEIRLLIQPDHAYQAGRHFAAARTALAFFDRWYGEYPYTTLTLVDGLGGSNGMEYPTLITCGTAYALPGWFRPLELVIIHEFGHQYWYGLLASNEFEEAWLDEGINSYTETRIMDAAYGPRGSVIGFPGLRVNDGPLQRLAYALSSPTRGTLHTRSWEHFSSSDYAVNSYSKPATVLHTLERLVGSRTMGEIMRAYYERWRFRHPTTRDFIRVAEDVSGRDLGWFFDQFVYGRAAVDYEVADLSSRRIDPQEEGVFEDEDGRRYRLDARGRRVPLGDEAAAEADSAAPEERPARYRNEVVLHRIQDGVFPQTLRLRFDDGSTVVMLWNGRERWKRVRLDRPARLVEAYLDPDNRVWLDLDRLNNRRVLRGDDNALARKYQLKFLTWVQQLFYVVAGLL